MTSAARAALVALTDELDDLAARVRAAFPDEVTCRRGCDDCCHQQVGVSQVEADRIADAIAALAPPARAALIATVTRATAGPAPPDVCGALDADGACQIYDARPVVCRTHGLIYGYRAPGPGHVRSCALNFRHDAPVAILRVRPRGPARPALVHDTDAGSARLLAIDRAFAAERGQPAPAERDRSLTLNALFVRVLGRP